MTHNANGVTNDADLIRQIPLAERKQMICDKVCAIHGSGRRANESSGEHLYVACPKCRQAYGHSREAGSKHLAINLDLYLSPARLQQRSRKGKGKGVRGYAKCMKCDTPFSIEDLMAYEVQPNAGYMARTEAPAERYRVDDGRGNMVPAPPGEEVLLKNLPKDHPAVTYLVSRGYDVSLLHAQFAATYCTTEAPEGEQYGNRFWRKHAGGFKSTPQGRIIFNAYLNGVRNCWQGRYLEMREPLPGGTSRVWLFHPYENRWVIAPEWEKGRELVKYLTAPGASKNQSLGGYDHAVSYAKHSGSDWCLVTEGPTDAARAPNNGLCVWGKTISDIQAILIRRRFRRVILGFDTDIWGRKACVRAEETLRHHGIASARFFPGDEPTDSKEDIGGLGYERTAERCNEILSTF